VSDNQRQQLGARVDNERKKVFDEYLDQRFGGSHGNVAGGYERAMAFDIAVHYLSNLDDFKDLDPEYKGKILGCIDEVGEDLVEVATILDSLEDSDIGDPTPQSYWGRAKASIEGREHLSESEKYEMARETVIDLCGEERYDEAETIVSDLDLDEYRKNHIMKEIEARRD